MVHYQRFQQSVVILVTKLLQCKNSFPKNFDAESAFLCIIGTKENCLEIIRHEKVETCNNCDIYS